MKPYKGIIVAGGKGSRLYPVTLGVNKHLLNVYDKPMIHYPLCILLLLGIKDILIVTTPGNISSIKHNLQDGSQWNVSIQYEIQDEPKGIADCVTKAKDFIADNPVAVVLGDNIFYGAGLIERLSAAMQDTQGAYIVAKYVKDPERFGVIEFDKSGKVISLVEKPENPPSNYAITGIYFYASGVCDEVEKLKPSARGEYEITDLNIRYLEKKQLKVAMLGRGVTWIDVGTHDALLDAGNFVATMQKHQGLKIYCIDEIAYRKGFISPVELEKIALSYAGTDYGSYLLSLCENDM